MAKNKSLLNWYKMSLNLPDNYMLLESDVYARERLVFPQGIFTVQMNPAVGYVGSGEYLCRHLEPEFLLECNKFDNIINVFTGENRTNQFYYTQNFGMNTDLPTKLKSKKISDFEQLLPGLKQGYHKMMDGGIGGIYDVEDLYEFYMHNKAIGLIENNNKKLEYADRINFEVVLLMKAYVKAPDFELHYQNAAEAIDFDIEQKKVALVFKEKLIKLGVTGKALTIHAFIFNTLDMDLLLEKKERLNNYFQLLKKDFFDNPAHIPRPVAFASRPYEYDALFKLLSIKDKIMHKTQDEYVDMFGKKQIGNRSHKVIHYIRTVEMPKAKGDEDKIAENEERIIGWQNIEEHANENLPWILARIEQLKSLKS
jgi:hypothetical protein